MSLEDTFSSIANQEKLAWENRCKKVISEVLENCALRKRDCHYIDILHALESEVSLDPMIAIPMGGKEIDMDYVSSLLEGLQVKGFIDITEGVIRKKIV